MHRVRPSIPTVPSLRRIRRRVDRNRLSANRVVALMHNDGLALHCSFERSGNLWWLTDGSRVSPEVAKLVVINPLVVGDALFLNVRSQTYHFAAT
jgi:hypothetical protein